KQAHNPINSVTVSVLPQKYFVQRIVGDDYQINVMIPPGQSEATYEPTPREMKAVSDSAIYFRIGHLAFEEAWIDKIASLNKQLKIVDTSVGVSLITGADEHSSHDLWTKIRSCSGLSFIRLSLLRSLFLGFRLGTGLI
ncbi:MAG: zinc ABC transporter substrate-binding protein, partial [Desulfobacterales bacterium]